MIIVECEQGSEAWKLARVGIPTASSFGKLVTNTLKDGEYKQSSQLAGYAANLAAELFAGKALEDFDGNSWLDRGKEKEAEAIALYEFTNDVTVTKVGFITTDDGLCGCSPDALVGEDGGLEVKCLKAESHVEVGSYYKKHGHVPVKYTQQVQACLWITGRHHWDQWFWHPDLPPLMVRQTPDPQQHAAFAKAVRAVIAARDAHLRDLRHSQQHIPEARGFVDEFVHGAQTVQELPPADPLAPLAVMTTDHVATLMVIRVRMGTAGNVEAIDATLADFAGELAAMRTDAPELYAEAMTAVDGRRAALK